MADYPKHDDSAREARIRECAYHLWEAQGQPYGRDLEFWQRARELVARENGNGDPLTPSAGPEAMLATPVNAVRHPTGPTAAPSSQRAPRRRVASPARKPKKPKGP